MAQVDIRRGTTGVSLPASVASEIWSNVVEDSAVMRAASTIPLPGNGLTIPMITGEPVANWVLETEEKPVSRPTVSNKAMTGYTIAVIEPFSNQFRRDLGSLYNALVARLPAALAKKFDRTVFGVDAVPGSGFDTLGGAQPLTIGSPATLAQVLAAVTTIAGNGASLTHWVTGMQLYAALLGSVNGVGQQYFTTGQQPDGSLAPSIFGAPVVTTRTPFKSSTSVGDDLGIVGDWAGSAFVGTVEGVTISISDQATINDGGTALNLWQRDMFAVRAEIEVGFIYRDILNFARITDAVVDTP